MILRTRFAPSPTGPLHLGHAYSAILAFDFAQANGAGFLLRLEDIDKSRARVEWEEQIYDDLAWLGLSWPLPVMRQSENMAAYHTALESLHALGVLYNCYCARRDILMAVSAPQEGALVPSGPDGLIYPGTCREITTPPDNALPPAVRLNMRKAVDLIAERSPDDNLFFVETGSGSERRVRFDPKETIDQIGDVVLARRDMGTSYHLSVVTDDAEQGITHVIRGEDLFEATKIHVILQRLLDLPTPEYLHHKLIRDDAGKRLAKRDDARAISKYRDDGLDPQQVRALVGLS